MLGKLLRRLRRFTNRLLQGRDLRSTTATFDQQRAINALLNGLALGTGRTLFGTFEQRRASAAATPVLRTGAARPPDRANATAARADQ